jgi:hypothetical protein
MARTHSAALKSSALFTTDIMNEPIAEGGLHSKFEIRLAGVGDDRRVTFEALGSGKQMAELELAAAKISEAEHEQRSNIIDLRTRKPVHSGSRALTWEVVGDAAPGRHSTGLFIFEALGGIQQIKRLAVEATRILA